MANANDFLNELKGANTRLDGANTRLDGVQSRLDGVQSRLDGANARLDDIKGKLDALKASMDQVDKTLQWGFSQLITLGIYTNQALFHNDVQNDTIICILEHISKNTCELLNEAHLQTGLQLHIENETKLLADLFAATHAEAALTREREEALRKEIEECCPPKPPAPVCDYEPCQAPQPLGEPPEVERRPSGQPEPPN